MAMTRETNYKGKRIKLTANKQGAHYIGTYEIEADPVITGTGADSTAEDIALDNAERAAKDQLDQLR